MLLVVCDVTILVVALFLCFSENACFVVFSEKHRNNFFIVWLCSLLFVLHSLFLLLVEDRRESAIPGLAFCSNVSRAPRATKETPSMYRVLFWNRHP